MEPQPSENIEDILGPQNQSNSDHLEDHDFLDEYKKDIVPDDEPDSQESNGNNVTKIYHFIPSASRLLKNNLTTK